MTAPQHGVRRTRIENDERRSTKDLVVICLQLVVVSALEPNSYASEIFICICTVNFLFQRKNKTYKMKLSIVTLSIACANAFVPAPPSRMGGVKPLNKMSDEVGIPCEEECALESFPNLPESVHPGVLSGQAMMDLLNHAKENGESKRVDKAVVECLLNDDTPPYLIFVGFLLITTDLSCRLRHPRCELRLELGN